MQHTHYILVNITDLVCRVPHFLAFPSLYDTSLASESEIDFKLSGRLNLNHPLIMSFKDHFFLKVFVHKMHKMSYFF